MLDSCLVRPADPAAEPAAVVCHDLLSQEVHQSAEVGEILAVRDEEAVLLFHMCHRAL